MNYLLKVAVALATAIFALPWPATVIIRGLSLLVDVGMSALVAKAREAKDSGVKAGCLLLSAVMVLSGLWPAALLLSFMTIWHERFIIWLFVRGLNLEDTRVKQMDNDDEPPPRYGGTRAAKMHKLPSARTDEQQLLSAPQALSACIKRFEWDPHEHGLTWDFGRQLWRDKDGFFTDMEGNPANVRAAS